MGRRGVRRRRRGGIAGIAAVSIGLAGLGCGPPPDQKSGPDATRSGAAQVPFGEPVDDRVSASEGDDTDWKSFSLGSSGSVTIEVWWDDPDVKAELGLRDGFGNLVRSTRHDRDGRHDVLGPLELDEGDYYLEVRAKGGSSVYTLVVRAGAGAGAPRPEF